MRYKQIRCLVAAFLLLLIPFQTVTYGDEVAKKPENTVKNKTSKGVAEFLRYQSALVHYVRSKWHWSEKNLQFKAVVEIKIDEKGKITDFKLIEPSGNKDFDGSVVEAVLQANPVPPPPNNYADFYETTRVTFSNIG